MSMEKFHFEHDGKEYAIGYMNSMKVGMFRDFLRASKVSEDNVDGIFDSLDILAKFAGEEAGSAIEDMTITEYVEFQKSWASATPAVSGK